MKCRNCGAVIQDGLLRCARCGAEVEIVPEYSPLDEMLADQIRNGVNGRNNEQSRRQREGIRVSADDRNAERIKAQRRRQMQQKKALLRKKKKQKLLIMGGVILFFLIVLGTILYQTSYAGQLRKGYRALNEGDYTVAVERFKKAVSKDAKKPDAYTGLSKVYIAEEELGKAEKVFLTAIEDQGSNAKLYEAAIEFYIDTNQPEKVSVLLDDCDDKKVLSVLSVYVSKEPEFSLEEKTYEDVQEVTLTSDGKAIYYTEDGSIPTMSSKKYSEPIQIGEGETIITAISVNKKNIPSIPTVKRYKVELPIADAPSVSPSTGQYEQQMQIMVTIPEGYEAYYTMDNTTPSEDNGKKYTGPIKMPEGNTIFTVILVDGNGRESAITKRNYELTISEE